MIEFLWGTGGGVAAVAIELIFKRWYHLGYPTLFLLTLPLQAVINCSVFQILQRESILGVAIYFSGATAILRLVAAVWMGGGIPPLTWVAYALVVGSVVIKIGEVEGRP